MARRHRCLLVALGLAAALAHGCAVPTQKADDRPAKSDGLSLEEMRQQSLESVDREACDKAGGVVRQEGMLGLYRCVIPYGDAGKECSDARECEGRCRGADDVTDYDALPGDAIGRCEINDSPFGCYTLIEDGVVQPALCID